MKKQFGCLSPLGILVALAFALALGVYTWMEGMTPFSPGPVSAAQQLDSPWGEFKSHADFETQCARCHSPWQGADPERCLTCHLDLQEQIARQNKIHGQLQEPKTCLQCHSEHRGRDADISAAGRSDYPHHQVGFSLASHRRPAGNERLLCADCHQDGNYQFDSERCAACHSDREADFVARHASQYGQECLACHDGSGAMANLDHDLLFPLAGGHENLPCQDCHVDKAFRDQASDCANCHEEPPLHRGQFGTHCAACHSAAAWAPAQLQEHAFPLDHGTGEEGLCQLCHPQDLRNYSCAGCHEHAAQEVERQHEGIDRDEPGRCSDCHPKGHIEVSKDQARDGT